MCSTKGFCPLVNQHQLPVMMMMLMMMMMMMMMMMSLFITFGDFDKNSLKLNLTSYSLTCLLLDSLRLQIMNTSRSFSYLTLLSSSSCILYLNICLINLTYVCIKYITISRSNRLVYLVPPDFCQCSEHIILPPSFVQCVNLATFD